LNPPADRHLSGWGSRLAGHEWQVLAEPSISAAAFRTAAIGDPHEAPAGGIRRQLLPRGGRNPTLVRVGRSPGDYRSRFLTRIPCAITRNTPRSAADASAPCLTSHDQLRLTADNHCPERVGEISGAVVSAAIGPGMLPRRDIHRYRAPPGHRDLRISTRRSRLPCPTLVTMSKSSARAGRKSASRPVPRASQCVGSRLWVQAV
jgi:hypothetical protein